jgi:hypothetical protein
MIPMMTCSTGGTGSISAVLTRLLRAWGADDDRGLLDLLIVLDV